MAHEGFQAAAMGLDELDEVLADLAADGGAMVLNVEALLSTKSTEQRRVWMQGFLLGDWPGSVAGAAGPLRSRGQGGQRARPALGARRPPGTVADQSACEPAFSRLQRIRSRTARSPVPPRGRILTREGVPCPGRQGLPLAAETWAMWRPCPRWVWVGL